MAIDPNMLMQLLRATPFLKRGMEMAIGRNLAPNIANSIMNGGNVGGIENALKSTLTDPDGINNLYYRSPSNREGSSELLERLISLDSQYAPDKEDISPFRIGNDGLHQSDEDFLHSNELWDSGAGYKQPFSELYGNLIKKNK